MYKKNVFFVEIRLWLTVLTDLILKYSLRTLKVAENLDDFKKNRQICKI